MIGDIAPITTPTVINDTPDHRLPWKYSMKADNGGESSKVRFVEIMPPVEEPVIEKGPEVIVPDFHDRRIGLVKYDLSQGSVAGFITKNYNH
jgi:hypothetical protein